MRISKIKSLIKTPVSASHSREGIMATDAIFGLKSMASDTPMAIQKIQKTRSRPLRPLVN